MEERHQQNQRPNWPFFVIAILGLALVFETGLLLGRHQKTPPSGQPASLENVLPHTGSRTAMRRGSHHAISAGTYDDEGLDTPFEEFHAMMSRMNRLFNDAMSYAPSTQTLDIEAFGNFSPAIDLQETDKAYVVRGDIPGLEKDKISVTVRGQVLTIEGLRESESTQGDAQNGYYRQERSYGSFTRSLTLPGPVDDANIKADYKNGVLTIVVPKVSGAGLSQKVSIQ
ncbi:MAG: Hsp20/alpha crystallin family protein [Candidatus Omnitrophica bacterium]|nr:Hsp20/alpha crystallin family protein [Candidatus Omnitrophota bacterium]MDD5670678.1 Hsp20/alpha crystallin family protein [Candidatus Omnitrophota bacterium]